MFDMPDVECFLCSECFLHLEIVYGGEREAGHHRHYREVKTTMVWPRQEDARGENIEINFGMGTSGEAKKRTS
jgi:hypothetical protein